jgi:hypothetical protein
MAVGENQSIGRKDKARASAAALARFDRARAARRRMDLNIHHRRADPLNRAGDRARVSVEQ